jgi:hypothetical protein
MRLEQFHTLVKLMRGNLETPSNIAASRVLCDNVPIPQATRESGKKRASIHITVNRYKKNYDLVVNEFSDANNLAGQFDLIVKLHRGSPEAPTTLAARAVLVDGVPQNEIPFDGFSPSALSQAVKRYRDALHMVSEEFPPVKGFVRKDPASETADV